MFCSNCGEKIEEEWQLCPNCGQKIREDPDLSKEQPADSAEENSAEGNPDQLSIFRKIQYWINMFLDIAIAVVFALKGRFFAAIILAAAGVMICPKLLNKVDWKKRTVIVSASIMLTAASIVVFVETPKEKPDDNRIQVQDEQSDKKIVKKENKETVPTEEEKTPEPATQEPETPEPDAEGQASGSDENHVFSPASPSYSAGYEADYSWYVDHDFFSRGRMGDVLEVICRNDVRLEVEVVSTDGERIGWIFNVEPDEIGGQGELIYYGDVVMIYYPEDNHIEIQTGDSRVAGSYYSIG